MNDNTTKHSVFADSIQAGIDQISFPLMPWENGHTKARNTDPQTSKDAANRNGGNEARRLEILAFLSSYGPATNEEIAVALDIEQIGTISPRVTELLREGRVVESGRKKNSKGNSMRVVRAA